MQNLSDLREKLKKSKDDPCWKGYVQLGTKKKNGKEVPNCVPKEEVDLDEARSKTSAPKVKGYKSGPFTMAQVNKAIKTSGLNAQQAARFRAALTGMKEEVEHIDELKKSTLASYIKKASDDARNKSNVAVARHFNKKGYANAAFAQQMADKAAEKRKKGIAKAVDKLAREEVDEAKVPAGMKFMTSHDYKGTKHTYYSKGNKMTDPVVVHIDGKEWKEFSSLSKAKAAALAHIKSMKEEVELSEKSVSKAQQKFFGMVRAKQKGEMDDASPEVSKAAKSMSKKDVKDFAKTKHKGLPDKKESVEEAKKGGSDYEIHHKDFSSAVQHALAQVKKKGYDVDEDEWFNKVASGPRKPSVGKTNSYNIELMKNGKPTRQRLHMQVYGMDSGKYELNMYVS